MPKTETYLFFNGKCAEAMKFYEKTLGGKLDMMKEKDAPKTGPGPQGKSDKILHARLAFDGGVLMASDWLAPQPYPGMGGFSVSVTYTKVDEAKRTYDALSKGGQGDDADGQDLLGGGLRNGRRSLRHAVDDQRWQGPDAVRRILSGLH